MIFLIKTTILLKGKVIGIILGSLTESKSFQSVDEIKNLKLPIIKPNYYFKIDLNLLALP